MTYNRLIHVLKAKFAFTTERLSVTRGRKALPLHPFLGNTGITCHLLNSLMSENEQPGQDLLEVEGILDLNEKILACSTPLEEAKLRRTTLFCQGVDSPVQDYAKAPSSEPTPTWTKTVKPKDSLYTYRGRMTEGAKATIPLRSTDDHSTQGQTESGSQDGRMTTRVLDLFCPMGGQQRFDRRPPRAGKTTILHDIAKGVEENHPECHLMVVLIDERPEEVTDFRRTVPAEIYASSNDEEVKSHLRCRIGHRAGQAFGREQKGVVLLLDSITRSFPGLQCGIRQRWKNHDREDWASGLWKTQAIFSARPQLGRSRVADRGHRFGRDGVENGRAYFSGIQRDGKQRDHTGPQSSRASALAGHQLASSGTRKEEDLVDPVILEKTSFLRRAMSPMKVMDAAESLIERMGTTQSNKEFLELIQTA